jgi:hypothetical protein
MAGFIRLDHAGVEAFRVEIGDLRLVTRSGETGDKRIHHRAAEGIPSRMGKYDQHVHAYLPLNPSEAELMQ